jgi:putative transposase
MPRVRRCHVPGAVAHVITRFVNGARVMEEVDGAREQYLERLSRAVSTSDWTLCWYALMDTHTHMALVCGEDPLDQWVRPLHSGWAGWVNRAGRLRGGRTRGPLIADRPMTVLIPDDRALYLGAYIHNNPVRAKKATMAEESSWTSHRAYLGLELAVPGLDVARGLAFYGCTPSAEGRLRFHEYVSARRLDPQDPELSGRTAQQVRRRMRAERGPTVELETPRVHEGVARFPVHVPGGAYRREVYRGHPEAFLSDLSDVIGMDIEGLRTRSCERSRTNARRVVLLAWRMAGRKTAELSAALAISRSAASNLVRRASERDVQLAKLVLERKARAA